MDNINRNVNALKVYKDINISLDIVSINLVKKEKCILKILNELKDINNITHNLYYEIVKNLYIN
jgi:hypothetical protein